MQGKLIAKLCSSSFEKRAISQSSLRADREKLDSESLLIHHDYIYCSENPQTSNDVALLAHWLNKPQNSEFFCDGQDTFGFDVTVMHSPDELRLNAERLSSTTSACHSSQLTTLREVFLEPQNEQAADLARSEGSFLLDWFRSKAPVIIRDKIYYVPLAMHSSDRRSPGVEGEFYPFKAIVTSPFRQGAIDNLTAFCVLLPPFERHNSPMLSAKTPDSTQESLSLDENFLACVVIGLPHQSYYSETGEMSTLQHATSLNICKIPPFDKSQEANHTVYASALDLSMVGIFDGHWVCKRHIPRRSLLIALQGVGVDRHGCCCSFSARSAWAILDHVCLNSPLDR